MEPVGTTARSFCWRILVEAFDYRHMVQVTGLFDPVKTQMDEREYMKAMEEDKFYEMSRIWKKSSQRLWSEKIAKMVKTELKSSRILKIRSISLKSCLSMTAMYTRRWRQMQNSLDVFKRCPSDPGFGELQQALLGCKGLCNRKVKIGFVMWRSSSGIRKTEHRAVRQNWWSCRRKNHKNPCRYRITQAN